MINDKMVYQNCRLALYNDLSVDMLSFKTHDREMRVTLNFNYSSHIYACFAVKHL